MKYFTLFILLFVINICRSQGHSIDKKCITRTLQTTGKITIVEKNDTLTFSKKIDHDGVIYQVNFKENGKYFVQSIYRPWCGYNTRKPKVYKGNWTLLNYDDKNFLILKGKGIKKGKYEILQCSNSLILKKI